jgi:2-methylcitrate dehydratase PrpD
MIWALGNAAMQAGGTVESFGSTSKSIGVANAARNGLLSAIMAKNGVPGPDTPIEGINGFLVLTCDVPKLGALTDRLGETWELLRNAYKPYPCGVVLHPVIDGCISAREQKDFSVEAVDSVTVIGSPLLKRRAERPNVTIGREAQISLQHAVAVTLLRGAPSVPDFSDASVNAPDVLALRARVTPIEVDAAMSDQSVRVIVRLRGKKPIEVDVKEPTGSLARPLSDADIERKFRRLAAYGCPGLDPSPLIDRLWSIESAADVAEIMRHARLG